MIGQDPRFFLTVLGSGTCVPSLSRSSCSVLVACGQDRILVDIGAGTIRRLMECGMSIHEITHICITHFHPDHTGELASFLFASKYPASRRRTTPLTLVAGVGIHEFLEALVGLYGHWVDLGSEILVVHELSVQGPDEIRFGEWFLRSTPVPHNPESVAYRITSPSGASVVISGDTDTTGDLVQLSRNADLLVCECSFPDNRKVPGHLTPSLAGSIAAAAGVKKLLLTHFYPECDLVDIETECRKTYNGSIVAAQDLMRL